MESYNHLFRAIVVPESSPFALFPGSLTIRFHRTEANTRAIDVRYYQRDYETGPLELFAIVNSIFLFRGRSREFDPDRSKCPPLSIVRKERIKRTNLAARIKLERGKKG